MNIITVATLAAELGIAPRLVQYRAKRLGVEKTSGIYLFTPEQAVAIRQYKTKPGPVPKPETAPEKQNRPAPRD